MYVDQADLELRKMCLPAALRMFSLPIRPLLFFSSIVLTFMSSVRM